VTDQGDVETVGKLWRHHLFEQAVSTIGANSLLDKTQPPGDPEHVRVNRYRRKAETEAEHNRRCLRAHTGQGEQKTPRLLHLHRSERLERVASKPLAEFSQHGADGSRLLVRQASGANLVGEASLVQSSDLFPCRESLAQAEESREGRRVRCVLAQDARDEFVDGFEAFALVTRSILSFERLYQLSNSSLRPSHGRHSDAGRHKGGGGNPLPPSFPTMDRR
jgi:hypothetical protein